MATVQPAAGPLTPAHDGESPQVVLVREESHEDEAMEVQSLHQNPVMIGCQEVQEEGYSSFTTSLMRQSNSQRKESAYG